MSLKCVQRASIIFHLLSLNNCTLLFIFDFLLFVQNLHNISFIPASVHKEFPVASGGGLAKIEIE